MEQLENLTTKVIHLLGGDKYQPSIGRFTMRASIKNAASKVAIQNYIHLDSATVRAPAGGSKDNDVKNRKPEIKNTKSMNCTAMLDCDS